MSHVNLVRTQAHARLASIDEAAAIAAVLREAFAEYEPLYTAAAFAVTTPTTDRIRARWNEGPVWVVSHEGQVVGTIAAVPNDHGLYLRSMAIRPAARGYGLGRLLLKQVETFAIQYASRRIFLSTTPFLYGAIRLYERFGFVRTSDGPHELHGTPLFSMEKPIETGSR
jgi:GNAT superfamily N-acetyltransferase